MPSSSPSMPSPTETERMTELPSPVVSSRFSQADTLLSSRSNYTANTGGRARQSPIETNYTSITIGRARQSWRGSNVWRRPASFLSNNPENKSSRHSSKSPTGSNPGASAPTQDSLVRDFLVPPVVELPAAPVAHPDEPRSFFDSGSDSDSDGIPNRDADTVISRASSVRVQRPHIIAHHSSTSASGRSLKIHGLHLASPTNPGPSLGKVQQMPSYPINSLYHLTPAIEEPAESSLFTKSNHSIPEASSSSTNPADVQANPSTAALPPTPHLEDNSIRQCVIEFPDTPTRTEALETLSTPTGGFGSVRISPSGPTYIGPSAVDGLRSNPVGLNRAISAPVTRNTSHPHRKVTIRPSDLVITDSAGYHRLFRESVVSTPYPTRHNSVSEHEDSLKNSITNTASKLKPTKEEPPISVSDRFPSPFRGETLLLQLALARHPTAITTVEIYIQDRSTFDDAALFTAIRNSYNKNLLGLTRRMLTARRLSHASTTTIDTDVFDGADFLAHLRSPKLGHKRKTWLQWLRTHRPAPNPSSARSEKPPIPTSFYSPSSTLPRMPFGEQRPRGVPCITLHHEFSVLRVALAVFVTLLMSVLATVLWILFGVPGRQVGEPTRAGFVNLNGVRSSRMDWKLDTQARVLTGLVLGVLVFLLGSMGNAAWVGGSWVLL